MERLGESSSGEVSATREKSHKRRQGKRHHLTHINLCMLRIDRQTNHPCRVGRTHPGRSQILLGLCKLNPTYFLSLHPLHSLYYRCSLFLVLKNFTDPSCSMFRKTAFDPTLARSFVNAPSYSGDSPQRSTRESQVLETANEADKCLSVEPTQFASAQRYPNHLNTTC